MKHQNQKDADEFHDHKTIDVDPNQTPVRIDKFLMDKLDRISRNRLQNAIKSGVITVDNQVIKPNYKVKPGDHIEVLLPRRPEGKANIIPQNIPLDIRYEDDDIIVLYKPAGMVVHPGIGHRRRTLANALAYHYQKLPMLNDNFPDRPGLVHRIDKNTSGLMVAVKNEYAMDRMAKQFYYHTIERKYVALVWGEFEDDEGTIRANVGRNPKHRKEMTVFPHGEDGKWAVTHWKVLERLYYVSVIECQLETGRTHQIRVHMKFKRHPLFSDEKYGGNKIHKGTVHRRYKQFVNNCMEILPRHALHAKSLGFEHPSTGKWMQFDSDIPEDMTNCIEKWRNYIKHQKELLSKG